MIGVNVRNMKKMNMQKDFITVIGLEAEVSGLLLHWTKKQAIFSLQQTLQHLILLAI